MLPQDFREVIPPIVQK